MIIAAEEEKTHRVILYKSVKELKRSVQPTIAILTVNYFEKLAVDTMIEDKITFLRHRPGKKRRNDVSNSKGKTSVLLYYSTMSSLR